MRKTKRDNTERQIKTSVTKKIEEELQLLFVLIAQSDGKLTFSNTVFIVAI